MTEPAGEKPKRRLNADERQQLRVSTLREFAKRYGRTSRKGFDPNDRSYDHAVAREIRQMSPEQFDALLRGEDE